MYSLSYIKVWNSLWITEGGSIFLAGRLGVSYECILSFLLCLLQLHHFLSFFNCINQTVSYISLSYISQNLESITLPCRAASITCISVFPAHFSAVPAMEILLWANVPFEICNTKLELKRVSYIQNSICEFFVTERSWKKGEVSLTWVHRRWTLYLLSMKSTVVSMVHLEYVRSNGYTLANGVASPHSVKDLMTVWERHVWETFLQYIDIWVCEPSHLSQGWLHTSASP